MEYSKHILEVSNQNWQREGGYYDFYGLQLKANKMNHVEWLSLGGLRFYYASETQMKKI